MSDFGSRIDDLVFIYKDLPVKKLKMSDCPRALLKTAMIYGVKASWKNNILLSLDAVRRILKPQINIMQADKYDEGMDDIETILKYSTGPELVFYVNDRDAIVSQGKVSAYQKMKNILKKRKASDRVNFIESLSSIEFRFLLHKCFMDGYQEFDKS